jgi:hypothetical protein
MNGWTDGRSLLTTYGEMATFQKCKKFLTDFFLLWYYLSHNFVFIVVGCDKTCIGGFKLQSCMYIKMLMAA